MGLYLKLVDAFGYKKLVLFPLILTVLMAIVLLSEGLSMSIEFTGGTRLEVLAERGFTYAELAKLRELLATKLSDLRVTTSRTETNLWGCELLTSSWLGAGELEEVKGFVEEALHVELREKDRAIFEAFGAKPELIDVVRRVARGAEIELVGDRVVVISEEIPRQKLELIAAHTGSQLLAFEEKNFRVGFVHPTLGKALRENGLKAAALAFVLITLAIFVAFRTLIPALAIMLAALCNSLIALGAMSALGIPLEPTSVVGLLMLLGYSVDTNILLTTRLLRTRAPRAEEAIEDAMRTGLLMTFTTWVAMGVLLLVSTTLVKVEVLSSIASVLVVGLLADVLTTWFLNAGLLRWYLTR